MELIKPALATFAQHRLRERAVLAEDVVAGEQGRLVERLLHRRG
jgi:hypothetical protein